MKKILSTVVLASVCILAGLSAKASHMSGSDMEFRCMGQDSFEITLRVYRDCNGIPINGSPSINFSTIGCSPAKSASVTMTRVLIAPVRFMCAGQKNICEGGSFQFGMEEHRFKVIVNFQQLFPGGLDPTCCKIGVVYQECCRNGAITNIVPSNFYINAEIDRCVVPCNSSPQISNYPVAVICNGQPFWFNNGILDTIDGDSISLEMADPLQGPGSPVSWNGSYNKDRPLQFLGFPNQGLPFPAGFHLDPVTGDLGFTSTAIQQPVLAFLIKEWRKVDGVYQLIGITRRDVQFFSYQCPPNNPPELEINGSKTGPFNYTACAGTTLCLTIRATDKDKGPPPAKMDTTMLNWNRGIPGATFTTTNSPQKLIREDEGTFCWTPSDNYVSSLPYYFTVKAEDDNCPVPGSTTRAIGIRVKARPLGNIIKTPLGCSKYKLDVVVTNTNKLTQAVGFQWTVPNVGNGIFNAINAVNYNTQTVPSHTFPDGGTYIVRLRMEADGCTNFMFDTIVVDTPVKAHACPDTLACIGDSKMLTGFATNGTPPYKYKWLNTTAADTNTSFVAKPNVTTSYIFQVKDSFLCVSYDTVKLEIKPLPVINIGPDRRICFTDSVIFDAGTNEQNGVMAYEWTTPKGTIMDQAFYASDSGQYTAKIIDSFSCVQRDSALLFVNKEVVANAGPDDSLCIYDHITLKGSGGQTYEWKEVSSPFFILSNADTLFVNPLLAIDKDYILKVSVTYGNVTCYDTDNTHVVVHPLPTIDFSNRNPRFCVSNNWFDAGLATGATPVGGYWTMSDTAKAKCFDNDPNSPNFGQMMLSCLGVTGANGNPAAWKVTYNYKDQFGCFNKDSINLKIDPLPVVFAGFDDSICYNTPSLQLYPYPNVGVGSEWLVPPSPQTNISNPSLSSPILVYNPVPRTHFFYPGRATQKDPVTGQPTAQDTTYMLVYKATDPQTYCVNTDTVLLYVKPIPVVNAGQHPPICEDVPSIDLNAALGASPTIGLCVWTGPGVTNGIFDPHGAGVQYGSFSPNILKYTVTNSYNCTVGDTMAIVVNRLPNTMLTVTDSNMCENHAPFVMNGLPKGPGGKFFINGVVSTNGNFVPTDTIVVKGKPAINNIEYFYKDPATGCQKSAYKTIQVQRLPKVDISSAKALCIGQPYPLQGSKDKTTSFIWTTMGDGVFMPDSAISSTRDSVTYKPGATDNKNFTFTVKLTSTDNGICPAAEEVKTIPINRSPSGNFDATPEVCFPIATDFTGDFFDYNTLTWFWGDGTSSKEELPTSHKYGAPGIYDVKVIMESQDGCIDSITKPAIARVNPKPRAVLESDKEKTTVALPRFTFFNQSSLTGWFDQKDIDSTRFDWDFGDPKTDQDTLTTYGMDPLEKAKYTYDADTGAFMITLKATTPRGCSDDNYIIIHIEPDITVFAPNAFRPSSSEHNNKRFYIVVDGQQTFNLDIFNRWGQLVYTTNDPYEGWDGKFQDVDCQQDVYAWQVRVTSFNGTVYKYNGTVTLLR